MKTSELQGAALDWAVAKCEGLSIYFDDGVVCIQAQPFDDSSPYWRPSANWSQGGQIIERERIGVYPSYPQKWCARPADLGTNDRVKHCYGHTPLITAMRCYVASKLGDEVEIPEELL